MISVKGTHFPRDVILSAVHLYVRYPVSYRNFQEIMRDRGVHIDHATLNRWVVKLAPQITVRAQAAKRQGARSWRMNAFLWLRGIALRIAILQAKCLNNIIAQDHRSIKRITRPVKGFKAFASAAATLAGIKVAHMVRKGQFEDACGTAYERFAALAGWVRPKIQSQ
ncbi:MAG: DDE-type integrase/transposase/recombinase [Pseudomonadota bacterium]